MPEPTPTPLLEPYFLARLEQLELVARKMFMRRMHGGRRSKRKGQSADCGDYRSYVVRPLGFLDKLEPAGPSDLTRALRTFSLKSSGKGVVVILSDFMDKGGYEEALRYLVARQMDIYAIQILSQEEIDPDITGDLKLVDVEDDDAAEITVNGPLLRRYKVNLAAYRAALHDFCTRRGVACLFTSTEVPFDRLVLTYLRQRGLVR